MCAYWVQASAPLCLIGQPSDEKGVTKFDLMNPIASALDENGQLQSVTYSVEDPTLRRAVNENKIAKPKNPTQLADVQFAARNLGIQYVMWVEASEKTLGGMVSIFGKATLYKSGKSAWEGMENQSVSINDVRQVDASITGIVSSLVTRLSAEALKGMPKSGRTADPIKSPGIGQAPILPEGNDDDPILNDFAAIQDRVKALIVDNRLLAAEMLLRDAIDAAPTDSVRRMALIDFLKSQGKVDAAVSATIDSAAALGDPSLTIIAARVLLDAGRVPEATAIINDSVAVAPNDSTIRLLLAEVRLRESSPEQALKHLEAALKTVQTAEAYILRATCRGLMGAEDGVLVDLNRAAKQDANGYANLYKRVLTIFDSALTTEGPTLRALFQRAKLKRSSDEVAETIDAQERVAKACLKLLGEAPADAKFTKSHGSRLLALNLLIQTMSELRQYVAKGDEDSITEAIIDLGEVLGALNLAKEQFTQEQTNGSNGLYVLTCLHDVLPFYAPSSARKSA
jgi:tetratricopeptide (TPR) repeat protein